MFATYSNENKVQEAMRELGLSFAFLAEVSGACSVGALHAWLSGTGQLSEAKQEMLVGACSALQSHSQQVAQRTGLQYPLSYQGATARFWKVCLAQERGEIGPGWELEKPLQNGPLAGATK